MLNFFCSLSGKVGSWGPLSMIVDKSSPTRGSSSEGVSLDDPQKSIICSFCCSWINSPCTRYSRNDAKSLSTTSSYSVLEFYEDFLVIFWAPFDASLDAFFAEGSYWTITLHLRVWSDWGLSLVVWFPLHFPQRILTQNPGRCLGWLVLHIKQISRDVTIFGEIRTEWPAIQIFLTGCNSRHQFSREFRLNCLSLFNPTLLGKASVSRKILSKTYLQRFPVQTRVEPDTRWPPSLQPWSDQASAL